MTSMPTRVLSAVLRMVTKPAMATTERALRRIRAPKRDHAPPAPLRRHHYVRERTVAGNPTYSVAPRGAPAPRHAVLYLHGGSYINEIGFPHWAFISRIADTGNRVEVPVYGLAPRHTHREALPYLISAYARLLRRHRPDDITIAGDSAGGGLALALTQALHTARIPGPARLILISPWVDATLTNPDIADIEPHDPWLTTTGLTTVARAWAAPDDPSHPAVSPINGDLAHLPPTDLYIGTNDIFHPDTLLLHDKATAAGATVQLHVAAGAFHVYPLLPVPEGRRATADILRTLTPTA